MRRLATPLFALPIFTLPPTALAGEPSAEELSQQLSELQQRYEAQNNALQVLEGRLRQMESYLQASDTAQRARAQKASRRTQVAAADQPAAATTVVREERVVKEAPSSRSAEAVYQEQHALFDRRFTLEAGLTYSRSDRRQLTLNGFLALDAIFLGNISVDEVKADILTLDLTGRYTLSDHMQVDLNLPFLYRSTTFQSGGAGSDATSLLEQDVTSDPQVGDVNAGIYYQLFKETGGRPDMVWNVRVKAPTGTDPYGIETIDVNGDGNLIVPSKLPSGNGVWALSTGLSFVKTLDPAILFANVGYFYNFAGDFGDIDTSPDTVTPGSVKLGNSFQYGLGTAFALNERMSLSLSYTQRFTSKAKTKKVGEGWTNIIGSEANAASMNFGVTYAMTDHDSMVFSVGAGLTPDAPDVSVNAKYVTNF